MAVNLRVDLTLDPEFIRKLVAKARAAEFDMPAPDADDTGDVPVIPGAPETEQSQIERLEEELEPDRTTDEVRALIDDCNEDEAAELVALVWIGRGDFDADEFAEAFRQAKQSAEGPTSDYLLGMPLFPTHLANGLAAIETE